MANVIGLVGRTVAEVERDLILETLRHCLGNRTRTAAVLGISIRTLRNKLNDYAAAGVAVPRPGTRAARALRGASDDRIRATLTHRLSSWRRRRRP